jgi:3-dehydroquinate synthase
VVRQSIAVKAAVVSEDETEQGRRAILNFGHTVAHALEATTDFELLHGEAVAIGMLAESELGIRLGITEESASGTLRTAVDAFRLPTRVPSDLPLESLIDAMEQDKKARLGEVRFTLLERIGLVHQVSAGTWTQTVSRDAILGALACVS